MWHDARVVPKWMSHVTEQFCEREGTTGQLIKLLFLPNLEHQNLLPYLP